MKEFYCIACAKPFTVEDEEYADMVAVIFDMGGEVPNGNFLCSKCGADPVAVKELITRMDSENEETVVDIRRARTEHSQQR